MIPTFNISWFLTDIETCTFEFECFCVCPLFFWHLRHFPSCYSLTPFCSVPRQKQWTDPICFSKKSNIFALVWSQRTWPLRWSRNFGRTLWVNQDGLFLWCSFSLAYVYCYFDPLFVKAFVETGICFLVQTSSNQFCDSSSGIICTSSLLLFFILRCIFNSAVILIADFLATYNCESVFSCMCN